MKMFSRKFVTIASTILLSAALGGAQSRHNERGADVDGAILAVTARPTAEKTATITAADLFLYENGIEQKIKNFSYDNSPSKIVLLVDNSQTLPTSVDALKKAAMEFAYEIFEGDQLFTIAYDTSAEIIQEWTDDAKKMETSLETFRKKGNPYLFDALSASVNEVLTPLMPATHKVAIVVIGDGLDRGSKTSFDKIVARLQNLNVTVYALQIPDRTGGAYRRGQPKATAVMQKLAEETGGRVFDFEDAQSAAKSICDELRSNRYLLSYLPTDTSSYEARRLLLTAPEGYEIRTKVAQPPNIK